MRNQNRKLLFDVKDVFVVFATSKYKKKTTGEITLKGSLAAFRPWMKLVKKTEYADYISGQGSILN